MGQNLKRCKDLIKIELEDLIIDIEHLLDINKQKSENDQITNYVFKENRVTLRDELNAIKTFKKTIDNLNTDNFESGQEILDYLENQDYLQKHLCLSWPPFHQP